MDRGQPQTHMTHPTEHSFNDVPNARCINTRQRTAALECRISMHYRLRTSSVETPSRAARAAQLAEGLSLTESASQADHDAKDHTQHPHSPDFQR